MIDIQNKNDEEKKTKKLTHHGFRFGSLVSLIAENLFVEDRDR